MTDAEREVPGGAREVLDVSGLPTTVFGHRGTLWWGTVGFIAVEGTTLAVAVWAYFYLMRNFERWPPFGAPLPDLTAATLGTIALLVMIPVMRRAARRAHDVDATGARRWLWAAAGLGGIVAVCRSFEFAAVHVRWDGDAYGSLLWILLGLHASLVLVDILETLAIAALLGSERRNLDHFADVDDAALYQYFLSLAWIPIYVAIYILPRV